jgi:hypothetical protein
MAHLKFLLTVRHFFPWWHYGAERYAPDLTKELSRHKVEVEILTASHVLVDGFL